MGTGTVPSPSAGRDHVTLFDRQVFIALNLASGDSPQTTYDLTVG